MNLSKERVRGVGFLLADVSRLLRRDFDRRVRALGMTQAQWRAIAYISRDEGLNQAALADRLEVTPITIARLIDRLEATGWVTRRADPADRRVSLLYLTPKTKPVLETLQVHADEARETLLGGLRPAERETLIATLERMKQNLIAAAADAAVDRNGNETDVHRRKEAR